jgi:hypothetical protein
MTGASWGRFRRELPVLSAAGIPAAVNVTNLEGVEVVENEFVFRQLAVNGLKSVASD